jgi:hypothetical protein
VHIEQETPENTYSLPQNSMNEKMVDPKGHHKGMKNSPVDEEYSWLTNGTIFISVEN